MRGFPDIEVVEQQDDVRDVAVRVIRHAAGSFGGVYTGDELGGESRELGPGREKAEVDEGVGVGFDDRVGGE